MNTKRLIFIIALMLLPSCGWGASHYVLQGAGGTADGSDWTNAYTTLPATLTRGDIYYIGDGSYAAYAFDDAVSATTLITIKKAVAADHGTETGWSSTFGDGTADFGVWTFSTNYWLIDGQTGGGPGSWNSGHGITVYSTSSVLATLQTSASYITWKHIKFYSDRGVTFIAGIKGTTGPPYTNLTISYCEFSNIFGPIFHMNAWSTVIIEYSYMYANKNTASFHSEGISSIGTNTDVTIRYNIWDKIEGTAVFAGVNAGTSENWQIYGNIFSRSVTTIYYYWEATPSAQNDMNNSEIHNNTIIAIGYSGAVISQGAFTIQQGTGNTSYNNLFYSNEANSFPQSTTHDYTFASDNVRVEACSPPCERDSQLISGESNGQDSSGSPFVSYNQDPLVANLALLTAVNAGLTLSSPFNTDMFGTVRGADGLWDRGAIELNVTNSIGTPAGKSILRNLLRGR